MSKILIKKRTQKAPRRHFPRFLRGACRHKPSGFVVPRAHVQRTPRIEPEKNTTDLLHLESCQDRDFCLIGGLARNELRIHQIFAHGRNYYEASNPSRAKN